MYPRIISIYRPNALVGVGAQGYSGAQPVGETLVYSGIPAEIQFKRRVGNPDTALPSDKVAVPGYNILIPASSLGLGSIKDRDIVVDDLGQRYQVTAPYWNVLGYNLSTSHLET